MRIALHDANNTGFPNLALMKISAYHKQNGDSVEWFVPLARNSYDKVYSSSVFTFKNEGTLWLPKDTVKGGTGYKLFNDLSDTVDDIAPDYSLYKIDYSIGFLTRGCPNNCPWCIVPQKEGNIYPYRTAKQICKHSKVVLMDNNVLACGFGIDQIKELSKLNVKVDFNQGLDAGLIDKNIAKILASLKWLKPLRMACDSQDDKKTLEKAVNLLRKYNVTPKTYFCYVLVKEDIKDALDRVELCRSLKIDPFAQPYRDYNNDKKPSIMQKHFARWVNHKAVFKSVSWSDYLKRKTRSKQ